MSGNRYQKVAEKRRTGFVDSLDSEAIGLHVQQRTGRPPKRTRNGWGARTEGGDDKFAGGYSHDNKTKV